jgi:hypothetical protein
MSMSSHSGNKATTSPTTTQADTPRPIPQPGIPIPNDQAYFRQVPIFNPHEPDHDKDIDKSRHLRDHEDGRRDIEHTGDLSYTRDKSELWQRNHDDKLCNADHDLTDSRYSDRDMDGYQGGRRGSVDDRTGQVGSSRTDSQYTDSDLDMSNHRRRDRGDKEWNYVRDRRRSDSGSKKYSSSGSSPKSRDRLASQMSGHELSIYPKTITGKPSLAGSRSCVPGLWLVKVGLNRMEVVDVTFDVEARVASRCRQEDGSRVSVRLVCLPTASVEKTYMQLDPAASPEAVTNAMRTIKPEWPQKGKIIIEVNPDDKIGRSWLPRDLVCIFDSVSN